MDLQAELLMTQFIIGTWHPLLDTVMMVTTNNMALIYEYMANGNLKDYLSGTSMCYYHISMKNDSE